MSDLEFSRSACFRDTKEGIHKCVCVRDCLLVCLDDSVPVLADWLVGRGSHFLSLEAFVQVLEEVGGSLGSPSQASSWHG